MDVIPGPRVPGEPPFLRAVPADLLTAFGLDPATPRWWAWTTEPLQRDRDDVSIAVLESTRLTPVAWRLTGLAPADANRQGLHV